MFRIFRRRGREDLEFSKKENYRIHEKLEKIRIFRRRGRVIFLLILVINKKY